MFETITLYENYIKDMSYRKIGNSYKVTLAVGSIKYRSDNNGKTQKIPVADYIDIGIFGEKSKIFPLGKEMLLKKLNHYGLKVHDSYATYSI